MSFFVDYKESVKYLTVKEGFPSFIENKKRGKPLF